MSAPAVEKIADAVLYEGYVLYPYRRSSAKNQFRWQFGIVAPRGWSEQGGEAWEMQTECLIEPAGSPVVDVTVRFLQVRLAGEWEEGVERMIELHDIPPDEAHEQCIEFDVPEDASAPLQSRLRGEDASSPGAATVRERSAITARLHIQTEPLEPYIKFRVRIENLTQFSGTDRSAAIRHSLVGAHTLLGVNGGAFVSQTDPPANAMGAARSCSNLHTWPVLAGPPGSREVMLSSPIILQDHPAIAPESQGDFFDATEIDEMLTLRVMTLTDEEKREACTTDERARAIIERCDSIPREVFERMHGAIRSMRGAEDFFNPPDEQPESALAEVAGGTVSKGARVRLAPKRCADSMDLFLAGRTAIVEGVHHDVENQVYVAVTVEGDSASDLGFRTGRFFYFYPEELELVGKETQHA